MATSPFFTITETLHFLRLITNQIKRILKKLGFKESPLPLKDFADTGWKQISGS